MWKIILFILIIILLLLISTYVLSSIYKRLKLGAKDESDSSKVDITMQTNLVFVLGKGGVGKSTYAEKISDNVISLDEIIRPWNDPNSSDADYVFNVYRPDGNDLIKSLKKKLIAEVHTKLKPGINAIEGAIEDKELIKSMGKNYKYKVVYLRPATREVFLKSMLKRVADEYKSGNKRLMRVWSKLTPDELQDYELHNESGKLFMKFMDDLADEKYATIDSTLPLLAGLDYKVVNITW